MIADVALTAGEDIEAIKAAKAGSMTIADAISSAIATIGENITLRRAAVLEVGQGVVGSYMHNQVFEGLGKIGVLVSLESPGNAGELAPIARQVAMHIASANPIAIDAAGVDPAIVKREKDILADKFRQQGKPEAMIEKITESGLKTFYKEQTLLEQPFIFDDKKSVAQALKEAEGRVGGPIKVTGYRRFALGEGIEKGTSDFAAEVAAAGGTT
jgi:elongation factor Ts